MKNNIPVLNVAYSPCPNDTFMFHDIATQALSLPLYHTETHLHDIQTLNEKALSEEFDITKLSIHAYLQVRETYCLLNSGAALGHGCGPIVVTKQDNTIDDLAECTIAIPGDLTTAHLMFRLWSPNAHKRVFMPFDRIMQSVLQGQVDAGVIIHEGRFVYQQLGLKRLVDLGQWWQDQTSMPLPLGCIAARRSLGKETIAAFDELLKQSIANALAEPLKTLSYVRDNAQEMDETVLQKHITTFVNDFSVDMGPEGRRAIEALEERAIKAGILQ